MHHLLHADNGHSYNTPAKVAQRTEREARENGDEYATAGTGSQPSVLKPRLDVTTDLCRAQGCDRVRCLLNAVPLPTFILPHTLFH